MFYFTCLDKVKSCNKLCVSGMQTYAVTIVWIIIFQYIKFYKKYIRIVLILNYIYGSTTHVLIEKKQGFNDLILN